MSTTATATRDARPIDSGDTYDAAIDRSRKRPIENEHEPLPYPGERASEIARVAETSTSGRFARGALTIDPRGGAATSSARSAPWSSTTALATTLW